MTRIGDIMHGAIEYDIHVSSRADCATTFDAGIK